MIRRSYVRFVLAAVLTAAACSAAEPPASAANSLTLPARQDVAMPSWLTLGIEVRGRAETATASGFAPQTRSSHYLHRLRVDGRLRLAPWLRVKGRFQDSRVAGWDPTVKPGGIQNTLEIGEAYLDIGVEEGPGWRLLAGRQPVVFGAMRVLSTSNWGNVGPRWDGARISYAASQMKLDFIAVAPVQPVDGKLDSWFVPGRRVFGFYGSVGRLPALDVVEPYVLGFTYAGVLGQSGSPGRRRFAAFGVRTVDRMGERFDYELELTGQAGDASRVPIRAWGAVGELGYRLGSDSRKPRLFARHQYAAGDRDPNDGRLTGFQQMYATDKWGTADGIAWRNIHETVVGVGFTPTQRLKILAQGRGLWLATRSDALYSVSGARMAWNPLASSNHVGEEVDVRVIWQMRRYLELYCGYGYMLPGRYLKESTPGASRHFSYVMWTARF